MELMLEQIKSKLPIPAQITNAPMHKLSYDHSAFGAPGGTTTVVANKVQSVCESKLSSRRVPLPNTALASGANAG